MGPVPGATCTKSYLPYPCIPSLAKYPPSPFFYLSNVSASTTDSGREFHKFTLLSKRSGGPCVRWKDLLVNKVLERLLYGPLIYLYMVIISLLKRLFSSVNNPNLASLFITETFHALYWLSCPFPDPL
ncbi:hypothetical protein XENTR_v10017622 [Xenopus tropicalis]|nr:hypothetical protein XENTR_v10017622 [Xenopus tropicalis]